MICKHGHRSNSWAPVSPGQILLALGPGADRTEAITALQEYHRALVRGLGGSQLLPVTERAARSCPHNSTC